MRRKRELYDTHNWYVHDNAEDPANGNSNLQSILQANITNAQSEIERICQE